MLRRLGHEAWTASRAGLSEAADDELTVYAHQRNAALITHDSEFSERRRKAVIGQHIRLKCNEWDAADVLERNLEFVVPVLERVPDVWVRLSPDASPKLSYHWQ